MRVPERCGTRTRQRAVQDVQERMVLPEGKPERDHHRSERDDQPRPELAHVLTERQTSFVANRLEW